MGATIIDGKALAAELRSQLKEEIEKKGMEVGKVYYFLNDDAYKISPIYTQEDVFALDLLYIWKGVVRLFLL